jgi:hypothetical protein
MVIGRDAVLVKHEGKKSKSQRWKELEDKGDHKQELKEILKAANEDGGQDAIESE